MKKYVFGYGSLINLNSLSKTLQREVSRNEIYPAMLYNYKRVWNLKESVYSEKVKSKIDAIFLNIQYKEKSMTNGVLFEIDESELSYLSKRERKYSLINVTDNISLPDKIILNDFEVITFMSDMPEFIQEKPDKNCFVMQNYLNMIHEGCVEISEVFFENFERFTDDNPFDILKGNYTFTNI